MLESHKVIILSSYLFSLFNHTKNWCQQQLFLTPNSKVVKYLDVYDRLLISSLFILWLVSLFIVKYVTYFKGSKYIWYLFQVSFP